MTDASSLMLPYQTAVSNDCMFNLKPTSIRARSYHRPINPFLDPVIRSLHIFQVAVQIHTSILCSHI